MSLRLPKAKQRNNHLLEEIVAAEEESRSLRRRRRSALEEQASLLREGIAAQRRRVKLAGVVGALVQPSWHRQSREGSSIHDASPAPSRPLVAAESNVIPPSLAAEPGMATIEELLARKLAVLQARLAVQARTRYEQERRAAALRRQQELLRQEGAVRQRLNASMSIVRSQLDRSFADAGSSAQGRRRSGASGGRPVTMDWSQTVRCLSRRS